MFSRRVAEAEAVSDEPAPTTGTVDPGPCSLSRSAGSITFVQVPACEFPASERTRGTTATEAIMNGLRARK